MTGRLFVDRPSPPNMFVATGVHVEPGATFVDVSRTLNVFVPPSQMKFKFEPVITTLPGTMVGCTGGGGGGNR